MVMNRADSKVGLAVGEVEKTLGHRVVAEMPSSRDVPASTNRGVPLVLEQPRHPVTLALRDLARRLIVSTVSAPEGDTLVETSPAEVRKGWRSLWSRTS